VSFAHLHLHTEYSMLDGAARVRDVVESAAADGQPAVAITDHGVLYGVVDFYKAAMATGVKPIIGIEAYVVEGSRFDRPRGNDNVRYHMTLLAVNETGYRNLMKLSSRAFLEGYYYKPRMDSQLLAAHAEGIVATSGCLGGPVARRLAPDGSREEGGAATARDFDAALAAAAHYQEIFGRDGFFIEIQDHGLEAQKRIMPDLIDISRRIGAPLLATNDAHYTRRLEHEAHDVLLCIQTGSNQDDPNRLRFERPEFYLKPAEEMRRLFPSDLYPDACDNTLLIADRAKVDLDFGRMLLPNFPVPNGYSEQSFLEDLVQRGARRRYGEPLPSAVEARIAEELAVIFDMGFPSYFLIVWDLIRYARERGIRVGPGRGSAAGSLVAYALEITDLDPLTHGLIFERFLNPGRRQMPDIDMDFDERYRSDVIRYAAEKYGSDHVAQIVTFSTIKGKQAIRDAARVLGHPYALGDRVAKAMPPAILGKEATLGQCLDPPGADAESEVKDWYANAAELREMYRNDPEVARVVDVAKGLEHLRRQDSIHAAAVVISPEPLTELVPVQRKGDDAEIVTQYEMNAIAALGLLKMDFLGLRNLSIIERTLELIRDRGIEVDIDRVPLDDRATYDLLCRGDTVGVFQLEGTGLRNLVRVLQPDRFEDIIALVSLYRPGPLGQNMHVKYADRKNGRAAIEFPHPATEKFLASTYGIIVYQEQVMQIAQAMAGYTMAEADDLRSAMGKKVKAAMQAQRKRFIDRCVEQGHPAQLGADLFDAIEPFAGYGFNKAHAACYALVAYQTAWLKAHHPGEYMAALLTATKRDKDRTAIYLAECRSLGIEVLVPDVNESEMDFSVTVGKIRFGLSAVRNVGEGVVEKILEERHRGGSFSDFYDFADRVDPLVLNRRTIESLVKAGGFDGIGHARRSLFLRCGEIIDATLERRRNEDMGQFSLFGGDDPTLAHPRVAIEAEEWSQKIKLGFEKEMLGLYVSDHPLLATAGALAAAMPIPTLYDQKDRSSVVVGGLIGAITRRFTKKGELMLFFQLEDLEGVVEVVAFPGVVNEFGPLIAEDSIVTVKGVLDHRGEDLKVVAREIAEVDLRAGAEVRLEVPAKRLSPDLVKSLKDILSNHPGPAPVFLHMVSDGSHRVLQLSDQHRVEPRSALYAELRELLGYGAVR
jgi:DNA polymerase-3 subunit alpha